MYRLADALEISSFVGEGLLSKVANPSTSMIAPRVASNFSSLESSRNTDNLFVSGMSLSFVGNTVIAILGREAEI